MVYLSRIFWAFGHLLWSVMALLVVTISRRGGVLVFTHYHDVDADGRDQQMGALVDELVEGGASLVEVCRIPLGPALLDALRLKKRLVLSQAALLAPAWLLSLGDPVRAAGIRRATAVGLLRLLRPKVLYLIDESGSGQPLLCAARHLGIRVVGIQHGDFAANPQYCDAPGFDREPADAMCVWSSWYRDRLLRVSSIYTDDNVYVTGRLRYPLQPERDPWVVDGAVRVLVLGERGEKFWDAMDPFVQELIGADGLFVEQRLHPADVDRRHYRESPSLVEALLNSHVVLGSGSSALLEAVFWKRPIVVCATRELGDPAGLVEDGLAEACSDAADIVGLCHRVGNVENRPNARDPHSMVWRGSKPGAAPRILAVSGFSRSSAGAPDTDIL